MLKSLLFYILFLFFLSFYGSSQELSSIDLTIKPAILPHPVAIDTAVLAWNESLEGYGSLSEGAKEVLYWTNYSRHNPTRFWDSVVSPMMVVLPRLKGLEATSLRHDLVGRKPVPLFCLNKTLSNTAQVHADDKERQFSSLSHTATNGTTFTDRMDQAGIKPCFAQNISLGSKTILLSLVLLYLDLNLPHQGHRDALLNSKLTEIGIGYRECGQNQFIIIQDMACSQ